MKGIFPFIVNLLEILGLTRSQIYYDLNGKPEEILKLYDCDKGKRQGNFNKNYV